MRSEKGVTLTALVIYVVVATAIIGGMAIISSFFYSNVGKVKDQSEYVVEYNKFNMFFIEDVKSNKTAEVSEYKIKFEDGTIYEYKLNSIYRNDQEIASKIKYATFVSDKYKVNETTKNLIRVQLTIGTDAKSFEKEIEYVLKYW